MTSLLNLEQMIWRNRWNNGLLPLTTCCPPHRLLADCRVRGCKVLLALPLCGPTPRHSRSCPGFGPAVTLPLSHSRSCYSACSRKIPTTEARGEWIFCLYFMCISALPECTCAMSQYVYGGQKRALDPLELESLTDAGNWTSERVDSSF